MIYRNEDKIKDKLYDIKGFSASTVDGWTYHINDLTPVSLDQIILALQSIQKDIRKDK